MSNKNRTAAGIERMNAQKRAHYRANKTALLAASKSRNAKGRLADPDRYREYLRKWKRKNRASVMWHQAKARAKKFGLEFTIEVSDIIIPDRCPALGIPMFFGGDKKFAPSLDRIDNAKGYIKGNIVVISWRANLLKRDATLHELEAITAFFRRLENENSAG